PARGIAEIVQVARDRAAAGAVRVVAVTEVVADVADVHGAVERVVGHGVVHVGVAVPDEAFAHAVAGDVVVVLGALRPHVVVVLGIAERVVDARQGPVHVIGIGAAR